MTPAQQAALRARMGRGATRATSAGSRPSVQPAQLVQLRQLLMLRLLLQRDNAKRVTESSAPASRSIIPIDKVAVNKFVNQRVTDSIVDAGVGQVEDWAKGAIGSALLGGGGIEGSLAGVQAGIAAAAPVIAPLFAAGVLGMAAINIFGGGIDIPTYATTPQLDATTPLGIAAGTKKAALIRADLQTTGTKFARTGARDPGTLI